MRETWVQSLGWEDPLEKERLSTPVFWPGEFHGLYSPWGHKELAMTKQLSLNFQTSHRNGITQYLSFHVWLISPNITSQSFIHVDVGNRISFSQAE